MSAIYEVRACHNYWVIVYLPTDAIVDSAKRKCDVMRKFRKYASYNS